MFFWQRGEIRTHVHRARAHRSNTGRKERTEESSGCVWATLFFALPKHFWHPQRALHASHRAGVSSVRL